MVTWHLVFKAGILTAAISLQSACGTENLAKPYTKLTTAEQGREALRKQDFELAIDLFEKAIEEEPENYALLRYLAASYAAFAGFDVFEVLASKFGEDFADLFDSMALFLPADPSPDQLEDLNTAIQILQSLPDEWKDPSNEEILSSKSTAIQISLYQTAHALMYMSRFNQKLGGGELDRDRLDTMTLEDAEAILASLEAVVQSSASPDLAEDVAKVLDDVEQLEGENSREKLISYIESKS